MKKRRSGYSLIELLLVIGIISAMMLIETLKQYDEIQSAQAELVAKHMKKLAGATETYMVQNQASLQSMGSAAPPFCVMTAGLCVLDIEKALMKPGTLTNWTPTTPWLSTYVVAIRAERMAAPSGVNCSSASGICPVDASANDLKAVIVTKEPWADGNAVKLKSLGLAVRAAGSTAGATNASVVQGYNGGWTAGVADNPEIATGQLAMVVYLASGKTSLFLDAAGTKPLAGDFNFGNQRIENVKDIEFKPAMTKDNTPVGPSAAYNYSKSLKISSLMPNYVLKGVFYGKDIEGGFPVEKPVCPDQEEGEIDIVTGRLIRFVGSPKIKVTMVGVQNDQFGGYSWGQPALSQNEALSEPSYVKRAFGGWNIWADGGAEQEPHNSLGTSAADYTPNYWQVYARRFYDGGYVRGEFMAEVFCYYDPVTIKGY